MLYFIYFAYVSKYIFFLSVLNCLLLIAGCWTKMVGGGTRTRRGSGRRSTRRTEEEAQQDDAVQQQVEQQAAVDAAQQDDDDAAQQDDDDDAAAQQGVSGSGSSGSRSIYLRGPASLPKRPILRDRGPLIRPDGER